jgi:hypothetical protein
MVSSGATSGTGSIEPGEIPNVTGEFSRDGNARILFRGVWGAGVDTRDIAEDSAGEVDCKYERLSKTTQRLIRPCI